LCSACSPFLIDACLQRPVQSKVVTTIVRAYSLSAVLVETRVYEYVRHVR